MNITNPKNQETIQSPFETDERALDALCLQINRDSYSSDFKYNIRDAAMRNIGRLSPAQRFWLHKLAMNEPRPAPKAVEQIDLSRLSDLLSRASNKLKRPAIVLAIDEGRREVRLSIAGARSKYTGSIMVTEPVFGGVYYGRVTDGAFFPSSSNDPAVTALLRDMADDPEGTASKHGHMTGKCCFCNRRLEDERSTSVGYGPVCAEHFGLAWGAKVPALA